MLHQLSRKVQPEIVGFMDLAILKQRQDKAQAPGVLVGVLEARECQVAMALGHRRRVALEIIALGLLACKTV
jgi:hypothetical protein